MSTEHIYRVRGVDRDGGSVEAAKPSARSARASVEDLNRHAMDHGRAQCWVAEVATVDWKPLAEEESTNV